MSSIEEIFNKYYKELCLVSYYYLKDINEAKDVVQDVFVKIISQNKEMELLNSKAYLRTAVRNASLKVLRNKTKTLPIEDKNLFYDQSNTEDQETNTLNNKIELYRQINQLPEQCRKIFLLCVLDDLKYQEVADTLKISINTVKTQMKKAFKILRSSLKDTQLLLFLFAQKEGESFFDKK